MYFTPPCAPVTLSIAPIPSRVKFSCIIFKSSLTEDFEAAYFCVKTVRGSQRCGLLKKNSVLATKRSLPFSYSPQTRTFTYKYSIIVRRSARKGDTFIFLGHYRIDL